MGRGFLTRNPGRTGSPDSSTGSALKRARRLTGWTLGSALGLGTSTLLWAAVERRLPVLRTVEVPVLSPGLPPVHILHLSDLHLTAGQQWLIDFVRSLAQIEVDLVISTGDNFSDASGLHAIYQAYEPLMDRPGAFVLGSNDFYSGEPKNWARYLRTNPQSRDKIRQPDLPTQKLVDYFTENGWFNLSNAAAQTTLRIPPRAPAAEAAIEVSLIGTEDPHMKRDVLPELPRGWERQQTVRLGVTHAPYRRVLDQMTDLGCDLVLAGHTHGGQLCLPGYGALVTNCDLPREYASGLNIWQSDTGSTWLHISAGLGTSRFAPVRLACRPEATLLRLVSSF